MKKVLMLILCCTMLSGCAMINTVKHAQSSWIGLNRTITLYSGDGQIIKQWQTRSKVEDQGGSAYFLVDGKAINISGTYIIEEK